jgi:chromosomal replication initiator protein
MEAVAQYYHLTVDDLVGKSRQRDVAIARQVGMYLVKKELNYSYEKIGLGFGGRNHTTVMHACNKTAESLQADVRLMRDINAVKSEIGL